jgi:nanoRNase/pAp phosphatase (c-di-AMP/oligoRNAs hydrolase)
LKPLRKLGYLIRKASSVSILCHQNADPDAVCSAYALYSLLTRIKKKLRIEIAAPSLSRLSQRVVKCFPDKFVTRPHLEESDLIFAVDTNTIQQLGEWKDFIALARSNLIVIDHHALHPRTLEMALMVICDEKATSTCEIIYEIYRIFGIKPAGLGAIAMILGIYFDSRRFMLAGSRTFQILSELTAYGLNMERAVSTLQVPLQESERIARLKAAQRTEIRRIGKWIAAATTVGSYQASVARALIILGAHVAVVGGEKKGRLRISLRATSDFYRKTRIHLGKDIAIPVGEQFQGMGGGHALAAGINGSGDIAQAVAQCLDLISTKFR